MKRMLSMLLVAAMLLSFLPVFSAQAYEEDVKTIWRIEVYGLPDEIQPGTAQVPELEIYPEGLILTDARWVGEDKEPVTKFQDGQDYYLEMYFQTEEGYELEGWCDVYLGDRIVCDNSWVDDKTYVASCRYTLKPHAKTVYVETNEPEVGMAVSDMTATVTGDATFSKVEIYDENYDLVQDGVFEENQIYHIFYYLDAKEGYPFMDGETKVQLNGETYGWAATNEAGTGLEISTDFATYPKVERVELQLSGVEEGAKLSDVTLTVVDQDNMVVSMDLYDASEDDELSDTFQYGRHYVLDYWIEFAEDDPATFSEDVVCLINGQWEHDFWVTDYGFMGYGQKAISLEAVTELSMSVDRDEIYPGAAEPMEVWTYSDQVEITGVKWVDTNKQEVTTFVDGNAYYLAVELKTSYSNFGNDLYVDLNWSGVQSTFEKLSNNTGVVYLRYSLEPTLPEVHVTVTGVEAGKKVQDVQVTVEGEAVFSSILFQQYIPLSPDSYTVEPLESDEFEAGQIYAAECYLLPKEGYRFGDDTIIYLNGEEFYNWGGGSGKRMLSFYPNTCEKIQSVTLTMGEVKVGKSFSDLQAKVPANANYTVTTTWYDATDDWNEATGKVKDAHSYYAYITLEAKDGYVFAQGVSATLNGKMFSLEVGLQSNYAQGVIDKSFLKPITKVELPAMPTSIKKGDKLPVATVSSKLNYKLEVSWYRAGEEDEEVTKADKDGLYLLGWVVSPKAGYEFTDEVVFTVGGKEVWPLERGNSGAYFVRSYAVNVDAVEKLEFCFAEPEAGAALPEVTIPEGADYRLENVGWAQSTTGKWGEIGEVIELTQGLYTYLVMEVYATGEKLLADSVTYYINGQKATPLAAYNLGSYSVLAFNFGKLGEIEKLTAPQLTKDGTTLSWNAVLNATDYEIYRATSKSGKYTKVATISDTTWTDDVTAGKTYYYKVKAIYSVDTSKNSGYSAVVSIDYKCEAPVITVENGSSGKPVVSWEKVSGAKKYTVYRATSETGKYTKLGTTTKLTYTDSKAAAGTTYFYKVIANASSSKYSSDYSEIQSCYVICGTPAVTIKNDTASGKPVLSWTKIEGATKYEVYLLGAEDYVTLGTVTGTSFKDESCYAGEGRYYGVRAIASNTLCNSQVSEAIFGRANCAQPKLSSGVNSLGQPRFDWQQIEGAVKYEVYRSTKSNKGYTLLATVEDGNAYADATAAPGKTYYYKVVAIGENCKSAESATVKLTGKCQAPVITVANGSTGKPVVSWEKVSGAKKYTVYRATSETGKYSKLGTTTKLTYTDSKAKAGTTYFYKVIANASSSKYNSSYSNIVFCGVICGTPSVTVKNDVATGKPILSWSKVEGATKYVISRQLPGEEFVIIAEQTGVTFKDTTAPLDTQCIYKVQAMGKTEDLNGNSSKEITAAAGIGQPKLSSGVNSLGQPRFDWQQIEGAVKYEVYRSTKSNKGYTLLATVEDGNAYADASAAPGKTYYYKVVAIGENSKSAESTSVKLTGKCAAPNSQVQTDEATGKPIITWEKVSGAKKYTVYRATSKDGKYSQLGTTTKLSYTDTKAAVGKTYFYKVVANASSSKYNSGYSYPMGAMTQCAAPKMKITNNAAGAPVVSWSKVTGAVAYKVMYMDVSDYLGSAFGPYADFEQYHTAVEVKGTSFTIPNAEVDRMYMISVVALAASEEYNSSAAEAVFADGLCAKPTVKGLLSADGKPAGYWDAVEGAVTYKVYRSTKKTSGYKLLDEFDAEMGSEFFIDDTAKKGKTYYYKVVAVSWYGESQASDPIKLKSK